MARKTTKPFNEMNDAEKEKHVAGVVSGFATRPDKISWNRKLGNMEELIAKVAPVESQIVELQSSLLSVYDEINALRQTMVEECIHPIEQLVVTDTYIECKFCNRKFTLK